MKKLSVVLMMSLFALGLTGCGAKSTSTENLKEVATHAVGNVTIVLLNSTGELKQGQNQFVVQFRDARDNRLMSELCSSDPACPCPAWRRCPAIPRSRLTVRRERIA